MKYDIIPFGIRNSVIRHAFEGILKSEVAEFTERNPAPFAVGDIVTLPTKRCELFGNWEVLDPSLFVSLPKYAVVDDVSVNTMYAEEKVFWREESKMWDIKRLEPMEREIERRIRGSLYWSCNLSGVPFKWAVPAEFLSKRVQYPIFTGIS